MSKPTLDSAWDLLEQGDLAQAEKLFKDLYVLGDNYALSGLAEIQKMTGKTEKLESVLNLVFSEVDDYFLRAVMRYQFVIPEVWSKTQMELENGDASLSFEQVIEKRSREILALGDELFTAYQNGTSLDVKGFPEIAKFIVQEAKTLYNFSLVLAKPLIRFSKILATGKDSETMWLTLQGMLRFFDNIANPARIGAMYLVNNLQDELATFEEDLEFFREFQEGLQELTPLVDTSEDLAILENSLDQASKSGDKVSELLCRYLIAENRISN